VKCETLRRSHGSSLFLLLSTLALSILRQHPAIAVTYIVPDDHPTIQAAIDTAASGDTILVRAGTYYENLQTQGKVLTLKSLDGPENTIIDGNHQGSVLHVTGDAWIEGFTIQNGQNADGGGIYVLGQSSSSPATVTIRGNIITKNRAGYIVDSGDGGGLFLERSVSLVELNEFVENYAGDSGGGIFVSLGSLLGLNRIENNTFARNACHVGGGAVSSNGTVCIMGNLIIENTSDNFGGGVVGSAATISDNTIIYNYIDNGISALGAGLHINFGTPIIERNIVAFNHGAPGSGRGVGILCTSSDGPITLRCNDAWGNDWDYRVLDNCDTTGLGNLSADPMFCDTTASDFQLQSGSPCAPENTECGLIGKYPVGCNSVSVRAASWGWVKTLFVKKPRGDLR